MSSLMSDIQQAMELSQEFSQFEAGPSTRRVKNRSKACLHCRRRKMRCDGVKPSCFQCIRAERGGECEYDDGITKTGTQVLYERLAVLEKRYRDLQAARRPNNAHTRRAPSHHPHAKTNTTNLARSNSVPDRVHSRPGVNGNNNEYSSIGARQSLSPFGNNNHGLEAYGSRMGHNNHYPQPFDGSNSSFSSHSSPRSGRSTPSTSDHTDMGFHPKYAFANVNNGGQLQNAALQTPYFSSPMGTAHELASGYPYDDIGRASGATVGSENLSGNPFDLSSLNLNGELSPAVMEHLVDTFIAHSLQANIIIFSNHVSDLSMMTDSRSLSATPSASTCLTDCFLLWGAHFSPHATLHALKPHFLARARVALPLLLSTPLGVAPEFQQLSKNGDKEAPGDKRYNVMVAICASSMLATYFFSEGRPIEGSYHANTASQLAICAGLHRSPDPRGWRGGSGRRALSDPSGYQGQNAGMDMPLSPAPSQSSSELLPPPSNQSHALERQHLFWTVFALDRGWSAAAKLPAPSWRSSADAASGSDVLKEKDPRTSISTPWPEDWGLLLFDDHIGNRPGAPFSGSRTPVEDFITGVDVRPTQSVLQLRAKSAALFEAATRIASLRNPYDAGSCFDNAFVSLQRTLSTFLKTLLPLSAHDFRPPSLAKCTLHTSYSVAHAAVMRLHFGLAGKAYKEGLVDRPSSMFGHAGVPSSMQTVVEGLMGYEKVYSQYNGDRRQADPTERERSAASCAGIACAAVDQCFASAREVVRIASYLSPDDISFLEPIIAPCWALAADVLLRELKRLTNRPADSLPHSPDKAKLLSEIGILETSLKYLGAVFPIGKIEAQKITSALSKLTGSPDARSF